MRNFSITFPIFLFRRAGQSVTSLHPHHPAVSHMLHMLHTFSLQDNLRLRQKLISSATFSSFSIPSPVPQLMMSAAYFHRPHSTGLSLFWLILFTLCFGSWMFCLALDCHSFLLRRKYCLLKRLDSIQQCYPKVLRKWGDVFMSQCSILQPQGHSTCQGTYENSVPADWSQL